MKGVVIHTYLFYNSVNNQKQLMDIEFIENVSGEGLFENDCTLYIPKAYLCPGSNYVDHNYERFLNNLDG
jgi:hypothetical protein